MYKGDLIVKPLDDGIFWELQEPFSFQTPFHKDFFCIPKGFLTDFASIPKLFWSILGSPATTKARKAAVCHDFLYQQGSSYGTREDADNAFLYLMTEDNVGIIKRYSMYYAVRLGGSDYFKSIEELEDEC